MRESLARLLAETREVISRAIADHPQGALFDGLDQKLTGTDHERVVANLTQPVVGRWLLPAVEKAPWPWRSLADLLLVESPNLPWLRSYQSLESTPELEKFRDFYSYQLFAGPKFRGYEPPNLTDDILVGFTLQAPHIFYPQHHHEPPEMYGVISGEVEWQVGDTWSTVGPGDVIVHRSHESHAMRTGAEPALTWAAWPRNPHAAVYMPSMDPPDATMAPQRYR